MPTPDTKRPNQMIYNPSIQQGCGRRSGRKVPVLLLLMFLLPRPDSFAQSKDETRVAARVLELRSAMIDADGKALRALTSEKLSYGHSSGLVEGKESFVRKIVTGESDFVNMELNEQTVTVSGNTAIVRHRLDADVRDGGKPARIRLHVVLVWQRQGGDWVLLARQAVKIP